MFTPNDWESIFFCCCCCCWFNRVQLSSIETSFLCNIFWLASQRHRNCIILKINIKRERAEKIVKYLVLAAILWQFFYRLGSLWLIRFDLWKCSFEEVKPSTCSSSHNKPICMYVLNHYQCFCNSAPVKCMAWHMPFFVSAISRNKNHLQNIRSNADMQIRGNRKIQIDSDGE